MFDDTDPWELELVKNLKDRELISLGDEEAWHRNPKYSHLYDKHILANLVGVKSYDLSTENVDPAYFPYIIKPRTNFDGLSKDCYVASSEEEIEDIEGMVAQECIKGQQFSADLIVRNGFILDHYAFMAHKNHYGEITLFESTPFIPNNIRNKISVLFKDYTGIVNCEYIEDKIIEVHLRPSLQFADISGGLINQLPDFTKTGEWQKLNYQKSYSKVYRTRFDGYVQEKGLLESSDSFVKPPTVQSVQRCWIQGKRLSDTDPSVSVRKRYLVINGYNLQDILNYGKKLRGKLIISKNP